MFNWFASKTARHAEDLRKHVQKLLNSQRDILAPPAISALEGALAEIQQAIRGRTGDENLGKQITNLETVANKWLKPHPHAGIRENVEVLLVALSVAMGIRTFFVQPFKIPTGSMQPTLYGVTPSPGPGAHNESDLVIPGFLTRIYETWILGASYVNIVAPEDGVLQTVKPPYKFLLFNLTQDYEFNHKWHTIWFPPDELFQRAGYQIDHYNGSVDYAPPFKAGEPIVRLKVFAGDHLFVDRVSYNFRHPKRGEIIVFETHDIGNQYGHLPPDQFYIKRLVGLGGERVQIGTDRHLIIDGKRLDQTTPHFEKVYSFAPGTPPHESQYSGHVNGQLAPLFTEAGDAGVTIRPEHLMVMGDNTLNSFDSRFWGDFSRTNVIGKYLLVYWPFSSRFGWSAR